VRKEKKTSIMISESAIRWQAFLFLLKNINRIAFFTLHGNITRNKKFIICYADVENNFNQKDDYIGRD